MSLFANPDPHCNGCEKHGWSQVDQQFSLGIFAGYWCVSCWNKSGYRKEGRAGFDESDAGEHYETEDY